MFVENSQFCELHEKCTHKTENCRLLKRAKKMIEAESSVKINNMGEEGEDENKQEPIYSV